MPPPDRIGPYQIRQRLGAGGMGEVYLAQDSRLRRQVALKGLTAKWARAGDGRRRLIREARAAAALNHPNIAAVYDIVESGDTTFIVMEYVPGESLARRVSAGPLAPPTVAFIGIQLAEALQAAHSHGLVHRDLKPANLALTPDGRLKVLDFGLACSLSTDQLQGSGNDSSDLSDPGPDRLVGTPPYIPPEAYRREPVDERGDIYSAGVCLYELLAGRRPFEAGSAQELAELVLVGSPAPLPQLNPEVSPSFDAVVRKAMSLRPEDRHPHAEALRLDLVRVRDENEGWDTVTAEGTGPGRARPTWQRWALAAALGIGILVPAYAWWIWPDTAGGRAPRTPTVVVLPFRGRDGGADSDLGAGLTDMLVTALAKVPRANVIGNAAIQDQLRQNPKRQSAARALGADFVVDGSVQRSGERLLVTLSLVNAVSNVVVWSEDYNGSWPEVFDLQRSVAGEVAEALELRLSETDRQRIERMPSLDAASAERFSLAQALLERADQPQPLDQAISLFAEVSAAAPRFALARAGLARAYWLKYELTKEASLPALAREASIEALRLDPFQPQVLVALAAIDSGMGRRDDAINTLRRAILLKPDSDEAHAAIGRALAAAGNVEEGVKEIQKAIRLRPQYWKHYDYLGYALLRASRYGQAETAYREIVRLLPESSWGYQAVGTVRHALGDREGALAWYRRALSAAPDDAEAHSNIGYYLYEAGRFPEAADSFAEAARLQPREASNHRNLADTYLRLGRDQEARAAYSRAVALLEEALELNSGDAGPWARLGLYRAKVGDVAGARKAIDEALRLRPRDGEIQHFAAATFCRVGDRRRALQSLREALDLGYSRDFLRADEDLKPLADTKQYREWLPSTKEG